MSTPSGDTLKPNKHVGLIYEKLKLLGACGVVIDPSNRHSVVKDLSGQLVEDYGRDNILFFRARGLIQGPLQTRQAARKNLAAFEKFTPSLSKTKEQKLGASGLVVISGANWRDTDIGGTPTVRRELSTTVERVVNRKPGHENDPNFLLIGYGEQSQLTRSSIYPRTLAGFIGLFTCRLFISEDGSIQNIADPQPFSSPSHMRREVSSDRAQPREDSTEAAKPATPPLGYEIPRGITPTDVGRGFWLPPKKPRETPPSSDAEA